MASLKPACLLERELPNPLSIVGNQLLTPTSSYNDHLELLDKLGTVGHLLSPVQQSPPKIIEDGLVTVKGVLISEAL